MDVFSLGHPRRENSEVKRRLYAAAADKKKLPTKLSQKRATIRHYLQHRQQPRPKKCLQNHVQWQQRIDSFFYRNDISRMMSNKRDAIHVDGVLKTKQHLLHIQREAYNSFKKENPSYRYKYSTFMKKKPKEVRKLKLSDRHVQICARDYNLEQKVFALNKVAAQYGFPDLQSALHEMCNASLCSYREEQPFPRRECIIRQCTECGVKKIHEKYHPHTSTEAAREKSVTWLEWTRKGGTYINPSGTKKTMKFWDKVRHSATTEDLIDEVCKNVVDNDMSGYLFRAD